MESATHLALPNGKFAMHSTGPAGNSKMETIVIFDTSKFVIDGIVRRTGENLVEFSNKISSAGHAIDGIFTAADGVGMIPVVKYNELPKHSANTELSLFTVFDFLTDFMEKSTIVNPLTVVLVLFGHESSTHLGVLTESIQKLLKFSGRISFHVIGIGNAHDTYLCDRLIRGFSGHYYIVDQTLDTSNTLSNDRLDDVSNETRYILNNISNTLSMYSDPVPTFNLGHIKVRPCRVFNKLRNEMLHVAFGILNDDIKALDIKWTETTPKDIIRYSIYYIFIQLYYNSQYLSVNLDKDGIINMGCTIDEIRDNIKNISFENIISDIDIRYAKILLEKLTIIADQFEEILILIAKISVDENISKDTIVSQYMDIVKNIHGVLNGEYMENSILTADTALIAAPVPTDCYVFNDSGISIKSLEEVLSSPEKSPTFPVQNSPELLNALIKHKLFSYETHLMILSGMIFGKTPVHLGYMAAVESMAAAYYPKESVEKLFAELSLYSSARFDIKDFRLYLILAAVYRIDISTEKLLIIFEEETRRGLMSGPQRKVLDFLQYEKFLSSGVDAYLEKYKAFIVSTQGNPDIKYLAKLPLKVAPENTVVAPGFTNNKLSIDDMNKLISLINAPRVQSTEYLNSFWTFFTGLTKARNSSMELATTAEIIALGRDFNDDLAALNTEVFAMNLQYVVYNNIIKLRPALAAAQKFVSELPKGLDNQPIAYFTEELNNFYTDVISPGGTQRAYAFIRYTVEKAILVSVDAKKAEIESKFQSADNLYKLFAETSVANAAGIIYKTRFSDKFNEFAKSLYVYDAKFPKEKLSLLISGDYVSFDDRITLIEDIKKIKYTDKKTTQYDGAWRPSLAYINKYINKYPTLTCADWLELFPHEEQKIRSKFN